MSIGPKPQLHKGFRDPTDEELVDARWDLIHYGVTTMPPNIDYERAMWLLHRYHGLDYVKVHHFNEVALILERGVN